MVNRSRAESSSLSGKPQEVILLVGMLGIITSSSGHTRFNSHWGVRSPWCSALSLFSHPSVSLMLSAETTASDN